MRPARIGAGKLSSGRRGQWHGLALLPLVVVLTLPGLGSALPPPAGPSIGHRVASVLPASTFQVNFTISRSSDTAPLTVELEALVSGGTPPYQYTWVFGDGDQGTGSVVNHTFQDPGTYEIVLGVTDALGAAASSVQELTVTAAPPTPPYLGYLLGGAVVAAVLGIGVGVYASKKGGRSPEDDSGPEVPELPSSSYIPPGAFASPPYQEIPHWVTHPMPPTEPGARMPFEVDSPPTAYPPPSFRSAPSPPPPARRLPVAPPAYVPPSLAFARPSGIRPPGTPAPILPAPSVRPTTPTFVAPPPPAAPPIAPAVPPTIQSLLEVPVDESTPALQRAAVLNALSWSTLVEEGTRVPSAVLSRALRRMEPLSATVRKRSEDLGRVRLLLRDRFQEWRAASPPGPGVPAPDKYTNLFAPSAGSETPSLRVRMGDAESSLLWQALIRSAPLLVFILVAFVAVEAATFFALYATYAGAVPTPTESLAVPIAVLGPPAILLFLFPIVEWGQLIWRRSRRHNADDHLFTLPQVRLISYLLVLGLAETSRVLADLAASTLFRTPSSILEGGGVSLVGVLGFLAVILATLFFAWASVSSWNVGGSRRAMLCASLLYVMVLAVWVGTEARLLAYFSHPPTWATVAGAQGLLLDVPLYLLIACAFVVMVFVAFTEPQWQREHRGSQRTRLSVAQAILDDLDAHPFPGGSISMDHLSDLARGPSSVRTAQALRELLTYDGDSDRYVAFHSVEGAQENSLFLRSRQGSAGGFYLLEPFTSTISSPGGGPPGSAGAVGGAATDGWWDRTDLGDLAAWTAFLRQVKATNARLLRPPSDARDGPTYKGLMASLTDPGADELRDLFRRVGWTKPTGAMLLVRLIQCGKSGEALCPEIETDGEYLEVELNRATGHADDTASYLGPWSLGAWKVVREVQTGPSGGVEYRASLVSPAPPGS